MKKNIRNGKINVERNERISMYMIQRVSLNNSNQISCKAMAIRVSRIISNI